MSWQYALIGSQVGLQFIGRHPRSQSSLPQMLANLVSHGIGAMQTQLNMALQHPAHYAPYPSDVIDPTHTLFVPRSLVFRLSKWCDHAGSGETDARKFTRALFRHGNELGAIPRRFVDQGDHPIPPRPSTVALSDFERWADSILAAWGGIPNKPHAVSAALGAW
jgi:hypothetical protein